MSDAPLVARYSPEDLAVFTPAERQRFLTGPDGAAALDGDRDAWGRLAPDLCWELLYRLEPDLYERLVRGEEIHPDVIAWLPDHVDRAVEVAAGTGRLTRHLAPRCRELVVVEPAAAMRERLEALGLADLDVRDGFFDALPVPDDWADLVASCSAFTPDEGHGGEAGLRELERVTRPGGLIVLVWPAGVGWLRERGFSYESFPGEMAVRFPSVEEAVELARIAYPEAVEEIVRRGDPAVPYDVLGMNPPRDLAWKRVR